jgi:hypothetical protein
MSEIKIRGYQGHWRKWQTIRQAKWRKFKKQPNAPQYIKIPIIVTKSGANFAELIK